MVAWPALTVTFLTEIVMWLSSTDGSVYLLHQQPTNFAQQQQNNSSWTPTINQEQDTFDNLSPCLIRRAKEVKMWLISIFLIHFWGEGPQKLLFFSFISLRRFRTFPLSVSQHGQTNSNQSWQPSCSHSTQSDLYQAVSSPLHASLWEQIQHQQLSIYFGFSGRAGGSMG